MNVYGYEQPVQFSPVEMFNPTTANMVLQSMNQYAGALQRQYEQTKQEQKDFLKEYGDFYSMIDGDTEAYYNMGIDKVRNALSQMYAAGIDPARSPEGRAAISNIISSAPVGLMNQLKHNAQVYEEYQKNIATMKMNGTYDENYEKWMLKRLGLDDFTSIDPATGRVRSWDRLSPEKYVSVDDATAPWFDDIKETYLGTTADGFDRFGIDENKLRDAVDRNMFDFINTNSGRYNLEQFGKAVGLIRPNATQEEIETAFSDPRLIQSFKEDVVARRKQMIGEKREFNDRIKMDLQHQFQSTESEKDRNLQAVAYGLRYNNQTGQWEAAPSTDSDNSAYSSDISQTDLSVAKALGRSVDEIQAMVANGVIRSGADFNKQLASSINSYVSSHPQNGNIEEALRQVSANSPVGLFENRTGRSVNGSRLYIATGNDAANSKNVKLPIQTPGAPFVQTPWKQTVNINSGDVIQPTDRTIAIADENTGRIKIYDIVSVYTAKQGEDKKTHPDEKRGIALIDTGASTYPIQSGIYGYDTEESNASYTRSKLWDKKLAKTTAESATIGTH